MSNIEVKIDAKYRESLDVLRQIIPDEEWKLIDSDSKIIETLIDSFMAFVQEQASHHAHDHEGGCCWGWWHNHEHWHEHWLVSMH